MVVLSLANNGFARDYPLSPDDARREMQNNRPSHFGASNSDDNYDPECEESYSTVERRRLGCDISKINGVTGDENAKPLTSPECTKPYSVVERRRLGCKAH
ncbi:hypothetical protein N9W34_00105 [Rickettsiales bacterium]|nr:hypothetical protein [Rickettsiales bacterium]